MLKKEYELRVPQTEGERQTYHAIRRRVLFELRGDPAYNAHHPDDQHKSNYPLLLIHRDAFVGVIRVDIEETTAIFRRVAIREDEQRRGHGRILLQLAESFAQQMGCKHLISYVNPEATGFYVKCGFTFDPNRSTDSQHVPMQKSLD